MDMRGASSATLESLHLKQHLDYFTTLLAQELVITTSVGGDEVPHDVSVDASEKSLPCNNHIVELVSSNS